jgi:hypothetical protein
MTKKLLCLVITLVVTVVIFEATASLFFDERYYNWLVIDERNSLYEHDAALGWRPKPNLNLTYNDCRDVAIVTNSHGFRGAEWQLSTRPRVLFIGDSYVWGYGVTQQSLFSERLARTYTDREFINLGISGFGPDQELLLYKEVVGQLSPQHTYLFYNGENDLADLSSDSRYNGYYKPYFRVDEGTLHLEGVPVPRSMRSFFPQIRALIMHSWLAKLAALASIKIMQPSPLEIDPPLSEVLDEFQKVSNEAASKLTIMVLAWDKSIKEYCNAHARVCRDISEFPLLEDPRCGGHWNEDGHVLVQRALERELYQP